MSLGIVLNLIGIMILIVILVLAGRWFIAKLGLGEPWPTIMILILVLILLGFVGRIYVVGGPVLRIGEAPGIVQLASE